jgi:hypothetical protein
MGFPDQDHHRDGRQWQVRRRVKETGTRASEPDGRSCLMAGAAWSYIVSQPFNQGLNKQARPDGVVTVDRIL